MSRKPRTLRRRSRQNKNGSIQDYWPWLLGLLFTGIIGSYLVFQPPATNPKTFCPNNEKNIGVTALIIDASDKLTISQKTRLNRELKSLSEVSDERSSPFLKKGDKLLVYFIQPEGNLPEMVFSLCHPGNLNSRTLTDKLNEGEIFARKKWEKFTENILESIEQKIDLSSGLDTSPIIETINYIRQKEFAPPDLLEKNNENYRLVIWSDLLQNSSIENHFSKTGDVEDIYKRFPVELGNIKLNIFNLVSEKYNKKQTKEQKYWWRAFISKSNGKLESWDTIG